MKKFTSLAVTAVMLLSIAFVGVSSASAQTATMQTLYDANNQPVNTGTGNLQAGTYHDINGHQIYYYGNGTYYDSTTGQYGGSIYNPSGTAGASLNYAQNNSVVTGTTYTTPGVPNTGAGGDAAFNWAALVIAGLAVLGGSAYITYSRSRGAVR